MRVIGTELFLEPSFNGKKSRQPFLKANGIYETPL